MYATNQIKNIKDSETYQQVVHNVALPNISEVSISNKYLQLACQYN